MRTLISIDFCSLATARVKCSGIFQKIFFNFYCKCNWCSFACGKNCSPEQFNTIRHTYAIRRNRSGGVLLHSAFATFACTIMACDKFAYALLSWLTAWLVQFHVFAALTGVLFS